jgi:hypothetical protein
VVVAVKASGENRARPRRSPQLTQYR